jgi:hypothetical protein
MNEREHAPTYLIEGDFKHWRIEAEKVLKRAKDQEKKKDTIPIWYDERTTRLVSLEKIKRKKMEVLRVKIGKGEIVWMEKSIAIKNGFINE